MTADSRGKKFRNIAKDLARRVNDYTDVAILSGQRRFLMQSLHEIAPDEAFDMLEDGDEIDFWLEEIAEAMEEDDR